ncbi:MAG: dihydrolipoyl dehydrogenase [Candidatus Lokiarchaeota archaeon]|nr:dihydrolipoyl dehydrogenase [Candidatus Lokiarchaeota archaeon]
MKEYDLIVIGSGAGTNVASSMYSRGLEVALVEHGRMGGTCLNRGCIPTKILTYVADLVEQAKHAEKLGVKFEAESIDFEGIMDRMRDEVRPDSSKMAESIRSAENYDWYEVTGEFVDDYTVKVGDEKITAPHIIIAAGARPLIPPIKGIENVEYHTNKTLMDMKKKPQSMIIVGGGYVATEFAHFFDAMGVEVTILGRNKYLVPEEDEDVSELLKGELSKRMDIFTDHEVIEVNEKNGMKIVIAKDRSSGKTKKFKAETLLIATGRQSNADLFKPEKTGVKTDEKGWIEVDEFFRTSKKNIWAFGDALGHDMFRHVANDQSQIVQHNISQVMNAEEEGSDQVELASMSYHAIPRAVFSYPQIATVGMTLREAKETDKELLVGKNAYEDSAKGMAMGRPNGFVRVIADRKSGEILGATIIGPYAPILIQEIVNLMYTENRSFMPMFRAIHIHPALPEIVQRAFGAMSPLDGHEHHH